MISQLIRRCSPADVWDIISPHYFITLMRLLRRHADDAAFRRRHYADDWCADDAWSQLIHDEPPIADEPPLFRCALIISADVNWCTIIFDYRRGQMMKYLLIFQPMMMPPPNDDDAADDFPALITRWLREHYLRRWWLMWCNIDGCQDGFADFRHYFDF